jgi:hypothetical protein
MGSKYYKPGYGWVVVDNGLPPGHPDADEEPDWFEHLEVVDVPAKKPRAKRTKPSG